MTVQELIDELSKVKDKNKELIVFRDGHLRYIPNCYIFESNRYARFVETDSDVEVECL